MKKTPLKAPPEGIPAALAPFLEGAPLYDSSSSPEARVIYTPKDGGLYLKRAPRSTLAKEAEMTGYFYKKALSAEPLAYISADEDFFLTRAAVGEDATAARYLAEPSRLAAAIGEALRALHEETFDSCPVPDRTGDYIGAVNEGYCTGRFDASFAPHGIKTAEEAYRVFCDGATALDTRVLLHGDYCLPNILFDGWRQSAFIDLGAAGVGDRHIDLFWGAWTLCYNLGTDAYRDTFYAAYGRECINTDLIAIIGCAECFG